MAKVLVVDDNAINRKVVTAVLGYEGHVTLEAADGAEALALARQEFPQLIISDVVMPSMDGYEFVRRLRADPQLASTAVIFHTAHFGDQEAHALAQRCQVTHMLPKPCDKAGLLRVVGQALGTTVPAATASDATGNFDQDHRRLIANKLAEKVDELQHEIDERKQADARIRHLNRVYAVLSGINSLIVRVATRDELCKGACRLAVVQGHFRMAWIGMVDQSAGVIVPFAWSGEAADLQKSIRVSATGSPEADGLIGTAVLSRSAQLCNDLRSRSASVLYREELLARGYRAILALPLLVDERAVGCLVLVSEEADFFDAEEMRLLAELAGDISFALDHIEKSERLNYLAYYDSLTGLPNRMLFQERLTQHCATARRDDGKFALVIANIDRFEAINSTLGRQVGDRLLRQVAERFAHGLTDFNIVGRIGADHFAVVLLRVSTAIEVLQALDGWWQLWFGTPFQIGTNELTLSAKAGVAFFPDDGTDADILLRNAETALSNAKATGDRQAFYTQQLNESGGGRLTLETKLRRALERQEFVLYYQPKVDLDTRRLKGVEALIRWQSPELGLVPPVEFIPLLEETGLIGEVGSWVLRQASIDRSRWLETHSSAPRVACNVSTIQLRRDDFVRMITHVVRIAGGEAGLDIEVTESLVMGNVSQNIEKLAAIRDLGVGIAIDDFGTGYSSLAYLVKLPVETLKIDRSFISAMLDDPGVMTLVSTMISLAHSLRLTVVAEGVEDEAQAKILRLLRCDQMQGYLISKPLSFDDMSAYLARDRK
jgi:diguanylate cyclase (GGDEF)-like protein